MIVFLPPHTSTMTKPTSTPLVKTSIGDAFIRVAFSVPSLTRDVVSSALRHSSKGRPSFGYTWAILSEVALRRSSYCGRINNTTGIQ